MESLLNAFVVLFVVVDPIGVALIFFTLTRDLSTSQQRRTALRGTALATVILLIFFLIGDDLLHRLNISIPAFRIAGGALLFLLAIDMVFARQSGLRSTTTREQEEAEHKQDVSVFPLAFPLIAGPGALTTVFVITSYSIHYTKLYELTGRYHYTTLVGIEKHRDLRDLDDPSLLLADAYRIADAVRLAHIVRGNDIANGVMRPEPKCQRRRTECRRKHRREGSNQHGAVDTDLTHGDDYSYNFV